MTELQMTDVEITEWTLVDVVGQAEIDRLAERGKGATFLGVPVAKMTNHELMYLVGWFGEEQTRLRERYYTEAMRF